MKYYQSGLSKTVEYRTFIRILDRTLNPDHKRYKDYGGRGIGVDKLWNSKDKFPAFLAEVGKRPSEKHSINRIDNELGYVKGNICWSTSKEQCRNRRNNSRYEYNGQLFCLSELEEKYRIRKQTIKYRLEKLGWSLHKTLTTASKKSPEFEMPENAKPTRRIITWNGQSLNSRQWSKILGISDSVIRGRLRHGWSVRDALSTPGKL